MSDLTLILDRRDLVVRMEAQTVCIERPGLMPQKVPLRMIGRVIAIGNPMVSCGVWRALAEKNIPVVLLPSRGKGGTAYIGSGLSGAVENRMAHYRAAHDKSCALAMCRRLIHMKLKGQERVLGQLYPDPAGWASLKIIRKCRADLEKADTRDQIMGLEGAAAAAYFRTWKKQLPGKWGFLGRNRRPPKDPVNALLSLGYVIAGSEVRSVIQKRGLDPALGILHTPKPVRDSFVLDILEPIRPLVDEFAPGLLDNPIQLKHFSPSHNDGCLLNKDGRKAFYQAWAGWLEPDEDRETLRSVAKKVVREMVNLFIGHSAGC
ncbi:MAG: CRISPR-associated endonuclease Cas1 [Desulfobacteraceae bacterium 4572_88]|nr:MAG: CRISPR-associated endonuclease Cas1 [Desulfobacteraceae bacterium 4572_88]